jgi:hypothetical protein
MSTRTHAHRRALGVVCVRGANYSITRAARVFVQPQPVQPDSWKFAKSPSGAASRIEKVAKLPLNETGTVLFVHTSGYWGSICTPDVGSPRQNLPTVWRRYSAISCEINPPAGGRDCQCRISGAVAARGAGGDGADGTRCSAPPAAPPHYGTVARYSGGPLGQSLRPRARRTVVSAQPAVPTPKEAPEVHSGACASGVLSILSRTTLVRARLGLGSAAPIRLGIRA